LLENTIRDESSNPKKAPNPKLQAPEKSQTPKPKMSVGSAFHRPCWCWPLFTGLETLVLVLGIWSFSGAWSLVFGALPIALPNCD
jgi:hypothetical protein